MSYVRAGRGLGLVNCNPPYDQCPCGPMPSASDYQKAGKSNAQWVSDVYTWNNCVNTANNPAISCPAGYHYEGGSATGGGCVSNTTPGGPIVMQAGSGASSTPAASGSSSSAPASSSSSSAPAASAPAASAPAPKTYMPTFSFRDVTTGVNSPSAVNLGDSFSISITGAPPNTAVIMTEYLNGTLKPPANWQAGVTDASGNWSMSGTWSTIPAGVYSQQWSVGGSALASITFTLQPAPAAPAPSVSSSSSSSGSSSSSSAASTSTGAKVTCPANYYVDSAGQCAPYDLGGPVQSSALPSFLSFLPASLQTTLSVSVAGIPMWLLAAGGAAYFLFSGSGRR